MEFHLRDPNMLQKLIDIAAVGKFSSKEHYKLVWDGHDSTYDITPSVHTFHLLVKSCGVANASYLFANWKVMNNVKLTIYKNDNIISFLPFGIISFHSRIKGDKAFHAEKPQEVEVLLKFLRQG